jgi:hypothetical protein
MYSNGEMAKDAIRNTLQILYSITKILEASLPVSLARLSVVSAAETTKNFAKKFAYSQANDYTNQISILSFVVLKKTTRDKTDPN